LIRLAVGHPLARAIDYASLTALGNVLANVYIVDLSASTVNETQRPHWSFSLHELSFWLLVLVVLLTGLYGWATARHDRRLRRDVASADLAARAANGLFGTLLERAAEDIRAGKIRSMAEVENMFRSRGGDSQ
jgi:threonine/homoserine/homoserine lactone efflux protein